MSGYVANNRNDRPPTATPPYDGRLDKQPPRTVEGTVQEPPSCLVSIRYAWNNGECLASGIPYTLTLDSGSQIQEGLDERGTLQKNIQANSYQAGLFANTDTDESVTKARHELQAALDEILAAERAEAARLQAEQDARNPLTNAIYRSLAFGKGFYFGAWGLLKTADEYRDLTSPHTQMWNALTSAWNTKVSGKQRWIDNFLSNFSAEQHRELVEALGFDPSSITREQIAEAYELACFLVEDGPSQKALGNFSVDYAKAQNIEEISEFTGAATFELVLTALLVFFTGGVGLAASARHLGKLKRLGGALRKLSSALKNAKIKIASKVTGRGTAARIVELEKPKAVPHEALNVPTTPPRKVTVVENDVLNNPRAGSANKKDTLHSFNDIIDNYAGDAKKFEIPTKGPGGQIARTSDLYQIEGSLNGEDGIFEWIVDSGNVTHRRFIPNGKITGFPNQVAK
ncbi:MAG: hypothetical protein ACRCTL_08320 [Pseudomonas sp.]